MIAPCVYRPVAISVTATPTLQGAPSGSPVLWPGYYFQWTSIREEPYMCIRPASPSTVQGQTVGDG